MSDSATRKAGEEKSRRRTSDLKRISRRYAVRGGSHAGEVRGHDARTLLACGARRNPAHGNRHRQATHGFARAAAGVKQVNISRLESREDPRLSTLTKYIDAMGGFT
jgi:hypothetical protein